MNCITFSADEVLIEQARRRAAIENTTLDELLRGWLERYVAQPAAAADYQAEVAALHHVRAPRHYSREEMNERR